MNTAHMLAEIRDANLSYLSLAQNLIRMDKAEATASLGISEESADLLVTLSPEQLARLASGSTLLCRFRVDDDMVWNLITSHSASATRYSEGSRQLAESLLAANSTCALA